MEAQSAKPMVVARTSPSNSDVEDGREDMSGSIRDGSGRDGKPTTTELTSKSKGKKDFKLMDYEVTNAVTSELQRRGAEGVANDGEPGQEELGPTSGLSIYNVDIRTGMNDLVGVA